MRNFTSETKQLVPAAQDTKRSRPHGNCLLGIGGARLVLLAIIIAAFVYAMIAWTTSITSPVKTVADQYYAAITHQQYAAAYSHLDTRFTFNGTLITEQSYSQAAIRRDATEGKVINYSISNVSTSWNFGQNIASATVHVSRTHRSYDVHLALKLEGNTYKITNFDDI